MIFIKTRVYESLEDMKKEVTAEIFKQGFIPDDITDIDLSCDLHSGNFVDIENQGIKKMIDMQIKKFASILDPDEIKACCFDIIVKKINDHEVLKSTKKGQEKKRFYSDILNAVKYDTQNKINEWCETIDIQENKQRYVLSPERMSSIDLVILDEDGEQTPIIEFMGTDLNLFTLQDGYRKSETYKNILDALGNKLNDKQKEMFHLVSTTIDEKNLNGNYEGTGRILKARDIKEFGKPKRPSDKAYGKFVEREIKKIIKIIKENININNITRITKLEKLKEEIESLLDDPVEKDILIYAIENIDNYYIENSIYNLNVETRK